MCFSKCIGIAEHGLRNIDSIFIYNILCIFYVSDALIVLVYKFSYD